MIKAGILSDTHDLLRPEVIDILQGCDCILHGGDICSSRILDELEQIAPVKAVRGNNDGEWAEHLPLSLDFELGGLRIYMAHRKKDLPENPAPYDLVIYGHSHQYASDWHKSPGLKNTLLLNPGSCGPRRFLQPVTMALLRIDAGAWTAEKIEIPHTAKETAPKISNGNIYHQITIVMKDAQRGLPVESIARKRGLDPAMVEQIVRLLVTHPGVTADGIMEKMGLLGKH